jgi:hypothetical protein
MNFPFAGLAPLLLTGLVFPPIPVRADSSLSPTATEQSAKVRPAVSRRVLLSTFKVEPQGNLKYELSIAPCRETECVFEVRLLNGPSVLASLDLDWIKAHGPAVKVNADESSGVGDPLDTSKQITAWSTGEEKDNVSTIARIIRLTPRLNGLLIDRQAGFDLLKRHHDLIVALGGKLVNAWTNEEGTGPTWSTVVVAGSDMNPPQQILAFNGFRQPSNDLPDRLRFRAYQWNADANKLDSAENAPPLYAVIAGNFKSAAEAHATQDQSDCFNTFWVLKSEAFLKLEPGTFVLAAVSTKRPMAIQKSTAVQACAPKSPISLIESLYSPWE